LVRKSERKRSLGRSRCKWKDKIIMDLMERNQLGGHGLDWRAEKSAGSNDHGSETLGSRECKEFVAGGNISFSRS